MPGSFPAEPITGGKSSLGTTLLRLQGQRRAALPAARQGLFDAWQEQWAERRDQISQQLTIIEAQLDQIMPIGK